jgi:hypothetical protein
MKSNTLTAILNGVLALSVLLSVIFCLQYIFRSREARSISGQIGRINAYNTSLRLLINDCEVYSERNHAIDPILESAGLHKAKTVPTK